jgi:hypothetical protein
MAKSFVTLIPDASVKSVLGVIYATIIIFPMMLADVMPIKKGFIT